MIRVTTNCSIVHTKRRSIGGMSKDDESWTHVRSRITTLKRETRGNPDIAVSTEGSDPDVVAPAWLRCVLQASLRGSVCTLGYTIHIPWRLRNRACIDSSKEGGITARAGRSP